MYKTIIITRHSALVEYLKEIGLCDEYTEIIPHCDDVEKIKGKTVIGPLPLHLAAKAHSIVHIPLDLDPSMRGKELTLQEVRSLAGKPQEYCVQPKNNGVIYWHKRQRELEALADEFKLSNNASGNQHIAVAELFQLWAEENGLIPLYNNENESGPLDLEMVKYLYNKCRKFHFETSRTAGFNGQPFLTIRWSWKSMAISGCQTFCLKQDSQ